MGKNEHSLVITYVNFQNKKFYHEDKVKIKYKNLFKKILHYNRFIQILIKWLVLPNILV